MDYPIILIVVFIAIILGVVVFIFRMRREEEDLTDIGQKISENSEQEPTQQKSVLISILVACLLTVGVIACVLFKKRGSGSDSDSSFAAFIPIWVVFISIIASRKKKGKISVENRRRLAILIGLMALGVATAIFLSLAYGK